MSKVVSYNMTEESLRIIADVSKAIEKIGNRSAALNMIIKDWAEMTAVGGDENEAAT